MDPFFLHLLPGANVSTAGIWMCAMYQQRQEKAAVALLYTDCIFFPVVSKRVIYQCHTPHIQPNVKLIVFKIFLDFPVVLSNTGLLNKCGSEKYIHVLYLFSHSYQRRSA